MMIANDGEANDDGLIVFRRRYDFIHTRIALTYIKDNFAIESWTR